MSQPPQTPPPPGSGPRDAFRGRPALAVGVAVAALFVIGGTVFAATSGGDDAPKQPAGVAAKPSASYDPESLDEGRRAGESQMLWHAEAPDVPGTGADAPGMWITDRTVVKAAYKQLVAYNAGDGYPAWDPIAFPQKICAVTPQKTADDKIVVAYLSGSGDGAECTRLQEVDLDTGEQGWDSTLSDSAPAVEMSLTGRTLMVGRSQSGTAYDVMSGSKLYDRKKYGDSCFPTAFAGGEKLVQLASCDAGTTDEHEEMQGLDPTTGEVLWTLPIDKGWTVERTYSVDPLVIYSTNEDKQAWNISTFTSGGTFRSQVGFDEDFAPDCTPAIRARDLRGCAGVAADADTLYLPTEATSGANEIVAINLSTGKEKWRVKSPADEPMLPLKAEGGRLIAYVRPSHDAGGRVVSIPTTGSSHKPAELLRNPQAAADVEDGFPATAIDWADGRLYLSATRLTGNDDPVEKLILAYGK
ncbi:PQQ-binding-like beta-propeller repeat protein [Streptomyces sp. GESEQ-35]|uniref:outer membrane protein assembly factor BamB family protein n=1 Tax=Streptomyces sp. GESEQ-35 TaxID=2812657 RepID=UPI001B329A1C|nr:PQQ-binding-like beta-propeller repeat protein [Streptomyces sp. GESEQ-35]